MGRTRRDDLPLNPGAVTGRRCCRPQRCGLFALTAPLAYDDAKVLSNAGDGAEGSGAPLRLLPWPTT